PHLCSSPLVFLSPPRRQPSPTLFPYTTLFRSKVIPLAVLEKAVRQTQIEGIAGIDAGAGEGQEQAGATWHVIEEPGAAHVRIQADRKSTRLNSSHVKISYAVFCLKKKKKKAGG